MNGQRDIEFVLDTGAEMSVITKPLADRLRIRPDIYTLSAGVGGIGMRGLLVGRLERLQIGSLDIRNVPTLIKSSRPGRPADLGDRKGSTRCRSATR